MTTTKKNLQVIVAVGARDNMIARASVRLEGTIEAGKVVVAKKTVDATAPLEAKVLAGLAAVISEMADVGVSGAVVIPDRYVPRYLQARKLRDKHNAVDVMVLPWMKGEAEKFYRDSFKMLLTALRKAENKDVFIPVSGIGETLRRIPLVGCENIPDGAILSVKGGIDTASGETVVRNNRFHGDVSVVRDIDKNGAAVVYGEILVESLQGKAKSFVLYGRTAVAAAYGQLPFPKTAAIAEPVEVAGNF